MFLYINVLKEYLYKKIMRIEDKFKIASQDTNYGAGPEGRFPSISKDLGDLFLYLKEAGVEIDSTISEKQIAYSVAGNDRLSFIPLLTAPFKHEDFRDVGYILRSGGLEISLENFSESGSDFGMVGPSDVTQGVSCKLVYEGDDGIAGVQILNKVRKVVRDFYSPFTELIKTKKKGKN